MVLNQVFANIDFRSTSAIIVAVSGGSDSLALLLLLKQHLAELNTAPNLIAVTIDHGLRPESRQEAEAVSHFCCHYRISHRILHWQDPKPKTGLPAAAREARYRLLVKAAYESNAHIIFTGHTKDDQIETFLMRKARGDGRGLAGMAKATLLEGSVWLLRPFLEVSRQDLCGFLHKAQVQWSHDPTNEDPAFERSRIRYAVRKMDVSAILAEISAWRKVRYIQNTLAANCLSVDHAKVKVEHDNLVLLDTQWVREADTETLCFALGILVAIIGGQNFLPGQVKRQRLVDHLKVQKTSSIRLNLSGSIIERGTKTCRLWREMRNLPDVTLMSGESTVWDNRFFIQNETNSMVRIAALSRRDLDFFDENYTPNGKISHRPTLLSSPAIYVAEQLLHIPALEKDTIFLKNLFMRRHLALFDRVLPCYDIALADAIARLFSRSPYPSPPFLSP